MFKKEDLAVGVVSILIGIGIIFQAQYLKVKFALDPAGPKALPVIIAIGIIVIGVIHVGGALIARKKIEEDSGHPTATLWFEKYRPVIYIILSSLIYAGLMLIVGPATGNISNTTHSVVAKMRENLPLLILRTPWHLTG